jgi:hypothetical protein
MPDRVRIISRPVRHFDRYIDALVEEEGFGREREYVGITTQERADEVRRGLRTAGRHRGVSVKAYWTPCGGCAAGGAACAWHVHFSAYDPEDARAYKERQARLAARRLRLACRAGRPDLAGF